MAGLDLYLNPSMVNTNHARAYPHSLAGSAEGIGEKWRPSSRGTGRGAAMIQTIVVVGSLTAVEYRARARAPANAPASRGSIARLIPASLIRSLQA